MTRNITKEQYEYAQNRVEELLDVVSDEMPAYAKEAVELSIMSDIVIDYENEHYPLETLSTAELIKAALEEKGKTQKELADMLKLSPSRISDFISGRGEPSLSIAGKICRILDINPSLMLNI